MIILGINESHNATAAILKDGEVVACCSEERLSRIKNDTEYPYKAINSVLEMTGISASELDFVAVSTCSIDPVQTKTKRTTKYSIADYVEEMHGHWKKVLVEKEESDYFLRLALDSDYNKHNNNYYDYKFLETDSQEDWPELMNQSRLDTISKHLGIEKEKVRFIDHHTAHKFYAYYASPRQRGEKALIITADGWGDGCNATISVAENGDIQEIHRTSMCNLARIYRWSTLLLGMKPNEHEYKVMGLAPYAKDYVREPAYKIYKETLVVDGLDFKWNKKPSDMYFYFKDKFEGIRFDGVAAGLQLWLEEMLTEWISNAIQHTGADVLYYSGGLSMNVKANKAIAELGQLKKLYVSPSGGDESLAIGAGYVLSKELKAAPKPLVNAYLGYEPSIQEAQKAIEEFKKHTNYTVIEDPSDDQIAEVLVEGKVLGRCVGKMEFGARSLGNRAILCDPSKFENIRKINEKIKFRDFWMPFTPSILAERAEDYIVNPKGLLAEYMTVAFDGTDLAKKHLKAAVHPYDFTVRPQLVSMDTNPGYYSLIKAFEKRTQIGAVLNTSLNLHGHPIVCSALDAMQTFADSGLDGLILPGYLILKKC